MPSVGQPGGGDSVKIIRTVSGDEVLVDDVFYDVLRQRTWYSVRRSHTIYAKTVIDGEHIYMHRLIMEEPEGMVVDHLDCNGLNNQRDNLEVVTPEENLRRATRRRARMSYDQWKETDDWKPSRQQSFTRGA